MSKICNNCGQSLDDDVNFCPKCKSQNFRKANEIAKADPSFSNLLFYKNYGGYYVLSKTKVVSTCVFLMFAVLAPASGAPGGILIVAVIFALITYFIGFAIRKILGSPSRSKITHNNYGLGKDLTNLLVCWQNEQGTYVFSKTKFLTVVIFIAFTVFGAFGPSSTVFVAIIIGLIFAVPAFLIGYGIHRFINPNPHPKKIPEPKKETPKPVIKPKPVSNPKPQIQIKEKQIIPEYLKYKRQIDNLEVKFKSKDKATREFIEIRFAPPQITYTRFIAGVDKSKEIFYKNFDSAITIITLADDYSPRIASEIESKISILKSIIDKLDDLQNELVLSNDLSDEADVENLIGEMDNLINSVKDY